MKLLRWLLVLSIVLCVAGPFPVQAEDEEGWKNEKLKIQIFKSQKEMEDFNTASYRLEKLFHEDGKWLDDDAEASKYRNFYEDAVGPATKSEKWRGVYIKRDGAKLMIDTTGSDSLDTTITKGGSIVTVNAMYVNPERHEKLAFIFYMEMDDWTHKAHWSFTRAYCWTGKIAGTPIYFFDDNNDGYLNVHASDGVVVADQKYEGKYYGSYLSTIVFVGGKLYELKVDDQGRFFDYRPYTGPAATVDMASKFKGPVKPQFVVFRTPFDPHKPDPKSVSILLPKGKGLMPEGIYEFKWTMLNERCFGADRTRDDQWIDDYAMPYVFEKGEKKYFPVLREDAWMKNTNNPVDARWDKTNKFVFKPEEKFVYEWGAPFCVHPHPYHQTEDGGAKVDNLAFGAWDFNFFDSSGVCFYAPLKFKTDGAAHPEDAQYNIVVYAPESQKPLTRNTRYVKGSGGGAGDAGPDWVLFTVPLGGQRGEFKIELSTKMKIFGDIKHFVDYKVEKEN